MIRGRSSISAFLDPDNLIDYVNKEVNERVKERIVGPLISALTKAHARHEYARKCTCTYCVKKRAATSHIGYVSATPCAEMIFLAGSAGNGREGWADIVREGRRKRWRPELERELSRQE